MKKLVLPIVLLLIVRAGLYAQLPSITRGPYLQVVTPTSVIIRWNTDQLTTGRVWFGSSVEQLTGNQREAQPTLEHIVTLTGLQPNTRYNYAIGYDETKLTAGPDYYVKTALPTGDTRPIRMWVLGDFGSGSDNQKNVYQAFRNATANKPADVWLWLGDNAYSYGREDEYQERVFNVYAPTFRNTPVFISPGNHDYADSETNFDVPYYRLFSFPQQGEAGGVPSGSKSYYSANYGNVHLISLDSQGKENGQFRLFDTTGTQVQWLKRDLTANKQPWTIVIFHHPPYSKGSHDSDTEVSMKMLRENLAPILERYGVDLVLNGHSHGYERTYRIKNLRGLAATFNKDVNVAQNSTGRYDSSPNSCPITTKEGTIYVVNGSGGQLGGQSPGFPHPATIYNNVTVGGSMLLDVQGNRLDAQFLMSDGSIGDQFTLMKDVNKTTTLTPEFADTLQLSASWPGSYQWTGGQTTRAVRYVADKAGTNSVTVSDPQQCLTDRFTLTVQQPPKLTTRLAGPTAVCAGSTVALMASPENTTKATGWQYDVLLSDASGNFIPERIVGSGSLTTLAALLPASLAPGTGYKIKVRPRGIPYAELVPSGSFSVKAMPTATLSGSTTVLKGESVALTLAFTGDGPWKGTLSDGTTFSGSLSPTVLTVQPATSIKYTIASLENSCGKGSSTGEAAITVLLPTGEEEFAGGQLRVYPNPAHDIVQVTITTNQKQPVIITLLDLSGQQLGQKPVSASTSVSESIPLPPTAGIYILNIKVGNQILTRKVVRQ